MKVALTAILSFALVGSLVAGLYAVEVAEANFYIPPYKTAISIISPQNITYYQNAIALNFTLESNGFGWYWYGIDSEELVEINVTTVSKVPLPDEYQHSPSTNYRYTRVGNAILSYLSGGVHTLTVVELSSSRQIMTFANATFKIETTLNTSPTITPTATPSTLPTSTPTLSPTSSPTQQPTLSSKLTTSSIDSPTTTYPSNAALITTVTATILVVVVGILSYYMLRVYFKKRR